MIKYSVYNNYFMQCIFQLFCKEHSSVTHNQIEYQTFRNWFELECWWVPKMSCYLTTPLNYYPTFKRIQYSIVNVRVRGWSCCVYDTFVECNKHACIDTYLLSRGTALVWWVQTVPPHLPPHHETCKTWGELILTQSFHPVVRWVRWRNEGNIC